MGLTKSGRILGVGAVAEWVVERLRCPPGGGPDESAPSDDHSRPAVVHVVQVGTKAFVEVVGHGTFEVEVRQAKVAP